MPIKGNHSINDVLMKKTIDILDDCKEELLKEVLKVNINRERILSYTLIMVDAALLFLHILTVNIAGFKNPVFLGFTFFHVVLFLGPFLFLYFIYLIDKLNYEGSKLPKIAHIFINSLVLIMCSMITIKGGAINLPPFAYLIATLCISSLILFDSYERYLIFIFPCLLNVVGTLLTQRDINRWLQDAFFFTLLTLLAIMISSINYKLHSSYFISNKMVIKKNEEIDNLYKISEETLIKRTKQLNETMEYEKLRTAFFANISHELRTPLNIIFSAEQMLNVLLSEGNIETSRNQINQYMNMMRQNCYRLTRLTNNLIDITKIDAGYFPINFINCDIVKTVEDITYLVAKYIEDRNISVIFDTEIEERMIACDPDKIERIILNLLSNAIKFTPEGGDINVNVCERDDEVCISVKDTGIGVPVEMQELIFERFVQVDKTTTRDREGSGIGLSIVKSLVDMHGGSVSLLTEPGRGSNFTIKIPISLVDDDEIALGYNMIDEYDDIEKVNIEFSDIY